ncbi:HAAS signaling domain-containing protein [Sphaerisporangium flaviroseum]
MAEEYLSEIERAAAALPVNRRAELLADVRSHIVVAQAEAASSSPAGIEDPAVMSQILSKLGDPEAIVAAALADLPSEIPPNSTARTASRVLVKTAVILLLIGGLLLIGWFVLYVLFRSGHAG